MGNCLDKALSDSSDENIIESSIEQSNQADETNLQAQTERASRRSRRNRTSRQGSNRYMQINESNSSLSSLSSNPTHIRSSHHNHNHHRHHHHHHHHHHNQPHQLSQSLNFGFSNSSSFMPSSLPVNGISNSGFSDLMSSSGNSSQVYYLAPNIQRTADQLTEEEQIKLLKRMTLIQQLPTAAYDENKKNKELV